MESEAVPTSDIGRVLQLSMSPQDQNTFQMVWIRCGMEFVISQNVLLFLSPLCWLLVFFFYNCLVSSNAHLGGIIQQPHQGRTRNCIGVSTSLSSWVNESHFMLNVQSREKTMQRENMKVVKEKQQLSNSSSVYLSISHSFESYIFFLSLLLPFNSFLMLILKTFSSFIDHLTAIALLISLAINPAHSSKNAHLFHSHRQHTLIRFINALCERVFLSYLPFWPLKERQ